MVTFQAPVDKSFSNEFGQDLEDSVEISSVSGTELMVAVAKGKAGLVPGPGSCPWGPGF